MSHKNQLVEHRPEESINEKGRLVTQLPCGLVTDDGTVLREVEIDEMDGKAEEILSDPRNRNAPAKSISAFLAYLVKSIGGKPATKDMMTALSVGDRDYLMLKIRVHSFGDSQWTSTLACTHRDCGEEFDVTQDINKLTVWAVDDDHPRKVTGTLTRGYTDEKGEVHKEFEFRFPTGIDQEKVGIQKNSATAKNVLMVRCLKKLGTLKMIDDFHIRRMKFKERSELEASLYGATPGVEWDIEIDCPSCGRHQKVSLDVSSLFRPDVSGRDSP